jgi:hypothetical protein
MGCARHPIPRRKGSLLSGQDAAYVTARREAWSKPGLAQMNAFQRPRGLENRMSVLGNAVPSSCLTSIDINGQREEPLAVHASMQWNFDVCTEHASHASRFAEKSLSDGCATSAHDGKCRNTLKYCGTVRYSTVQYDVLTIDRSSFPRYYMAYRIYSFTVSSTWF